MGSSRGARQGASLSGGPPFHTRCLDAAGRLYECVFRGYTRTETSPQGPGLGGPGLAAPQSPGRSTTASHQRHAGGLCCYWVAGEEGAEQQTNAASISTWRIPRRGQSRQLGCPPDPVSGAQPSLFHCRSTQLGRHSLCSCHDVFVFSSLSDCGCLDVRSVSVRQPFSYSAIHCPEQS